MAQNTTVAYLFKSVPLSADYNDIINSADMLDFLTSNYEHLRVDNIAYQNININVNRASSSMTLNGNHDTYEEYNYMIFNNTGEDTFYCCFIDSLHAESASTTTIFYSIDLFHTYWANATLLSSHVVREHVSSDDPTHWGVPEALPFGDYVRGRSDTIGAGGTIYYYLMINPPTYDASDDKTDWSRYNKWKRDFGSAMQVTSSAVLGITSALEIFMTSSAAAMNTALTATSLTEGGAIGIAPAGLTTYVSRIVASNINISAASSESTFDLQNTWKIQFGSYMPTNNKCHSAPYRRFVVGSYDGQMVEIPNAQVIKDNSLSVTYGQANSLGGGRYLKIPYGNIIDQEMFSTCEADIPVSVDAGQNALAQLKLAQSNQLTASAIGMLGSTGLALATQNYVGAGIAAAGGLAGIGANLLSQKSQRQNAAAQAISTNMPKLGNSVVDLASGRTGFYYQVFEAPENEMRRIDKYFSEFGYQVESYKVPNITGHSPYNYVQTDGCRVSGNIPNPARQVICGVFDKGVRVWNSKPI